MIIAIAALIGAVCVGMLSLPFLRHNQSRYAGNPLQIIDTLKNDRKRIYQDITNLKNDRASGIVATSEFDDTSSNLLIRAADNLRLQHIWEAKVKEIDQIIEHEISNCEDTA